MFFGAKYFLFESYVTLEILNPHATFFFIVTMHIQTIFDLIIKITGTWYVLKSFMYSTFGIVDSCDIVYCVLMERVYFTR